MSKKNNRKNTVILVEMIVLTIIVVVIQQIDLRLWSHFSTILCIIPILYGSIVSGNIGGTWLGFAFGITTLFRPGVEDFISVNASAGINLCLIMGASAGVITPIIYKCFLKKKGKTFAAFTGAFAWTFTKNIIAFVFYMFFFRAVFVKMGIIDPRMISKKVTLNLVFQTVQELIFGAIFAPIVLKLVKLNEEKILNKL